MIKRIATIRAASALCAMVLLGAPSSLLAQDTANPFTGIVRDSWNMVKKNVAAAATSMPESEYSFKPTPEVRSFGELVGHVANANYMICSTVKGEKNPSSANFEKTSAKAELVKALNDSITYCDGVFAAATDATATDQVDLFGRKFKKLGALELAVAHSNEHYGNFVTYMRLKGHVPPSSAGRSSATR